MMQKKISDEIKKRVEKGDIVRVTVNSNDNIVFSLPINAAIVAGAVGLLASPWLVFAAMLTTIGFDCTIELEKDDGTTIEYSCRDLGKRVMDAVDDVASDVVEKVKEKKKQ